MYSTHIESVGSTGHKVARTRTVLRAVDAVIDHSVFFYVVPSSR